MKRQGWALWIGMVFGATGMAQPPADGERYPPAPEMPGVVVSKPAGGRPTATVSEMQLKPVSFQNPAAPPAPTIVTATQLPYTNVATAQVAPVSGFGPRMMAPQGPVIPVNGMMAPELMSGGCSTPACASGTCSTGTGVGSGHSGKWGEWFGFHSTSKQTGCYTYPYHPPLTAWFPCKPNVGGCSSCAAPQAGCAGGNCGGMMNPVAMVPTGPVDVSGGSSVRPVVHVDLKPVAPQPAAPKTPVAVAPTDPLANFKKMEGMSFTPGGSPMAAPVPRK